jgi:glycopeptide antibiotics resistance protein
MLKSQPIILLENLLGLAASIPFGVRSKLCIIRLILQGQLVYAENFSFVVPFVAVYLLLCLANDILKLPVEGGSCLGVFILLELALRLANDRLDRS